MSKTNGHSKKKNGANSTHVEMLQVPPIDSDTSRLLEIGRQRIEVQAKMRNKLGAVVTELEEEYPDFRDVLMGMLEGHAQRMLREREVERRERRDGIRR